MSLQKYLIVIFIFTSAGCYSESGFNSSNPQAAVKKENRDSDAIPEAQIENPISGNVVQREIIAQESLVQQRNPFGAAESNIYSYKATQRLDEEYRFALDNKSVKTDFQLTNRYSDRMENFRQINRPLLSQNFQQGNPGNQINDQFNQEDKRGMVDILIVIDDSGSMTEEQQNLSDKLLDLLAFIDKADWKIGFVTTTPKPDCVITLISHNDPDAMTRFSLAAQPGTKGSGNEAGIKEAVNGLRCTGNPWVRQGATLAVLIVSDEDNCSLNGRGCRGQAWEFENYLIDYVEQDMGREISKNAAFYGIFSHPDQRCRTAYNPGFQYQRLIEYKANGEKRWGDICDASYSNTLRTISENIASLLINQFELTQTPDAGSVVTVDIEVGGIRTPADPNHYHIIGRTLSFFEGYEPPAASTIHASYRVGATPMFNQVTLLETPAPGTSRVMVNGNVLDSETYQINGLTLSFNQQPAANAAIQVDYRRNQNLVNQFTINGIARDNQLQVSVQDVSTTAFKYDPSTRLVSLDKTPSDNQYVVIRYSNYDGPNLSYTLPLSSGNPRDFQILHNNLPISFQRSGTTFTIGAGDHTENRQMVLTYKTDDDAEKSFTLPSVPIKDSLVLDGMNSGCNFGNGFELQYQTLIARCTVRDLTEFRLTYDYFTSTRRFDVANLSDPEAFMWEVLVDGRSTAAYQRQGSVVTLDQEPALGARVDIYLTPLD